MIGTILCAGATHRILANTARGATLTWAAIIGACGGGSGSNDPASGLTATQPVQSTSTPAAQAHRLGVGIDAQGNAVAAWSQLDGNAMMVWGQGDASIRATVAPSGASWATPTVLKPAGGRSVGSVMVAAMDGLGHAMVTWTQGNDQGGADAMLATRTPTAGWVAGAIHQGAIWSDPFVAMNDSGHALFLRTQLRECLHGHASPGATLQLGALAHRRGESGAA